MILKVGFLKLRLNTERNFHLLLF